MVRKPEWYKYKQYEPLPKGYSMTSSPTHSHFLILLVRAFARNWSITRTSDGGCAGGGVLIKIDGLKLEST